MDVSAFLEPRIAPRAVFERAGQHPHRPRFLLPDAKGAVTATVTWGEFAEQLRAIALGLVELGVAPGDRVAVFAPNSVAWGAAALAIQAMGGVLVPIYGSSTADDARYVLEHSDAAAVFVDTAPLLERAKDTRARVIWMGAAPAEGVTSLGAVMALGREVHARDPGRLDALMDAVPLSAFGMMLYTSGTSGRPKGVPLTHENVAANGRDWLECNAPILHEDAVDLLWLPMSHIFGFGELCLGNTLGFTTWMTTPLEVLGLIPIVRPTVFMSVPALWEKLAKGAMESKDPAERRERLAASTGGRLRFCLSGGAGLKREVKELFYEAGVLIIEGYGLTEASPTLTLNRPGAFRFDSVGKPLPSVSLRLADDGEILARGPNVFSGYHKDPAATAEAFDGDGWLKTGDVGRFTEDGFLQIIDRKKDILVTAGGKNIPPANIELRFADEPIFLHVVVYGDAKRYLTAGVWLEPRLAEATRAAEGHATLEALVASRIERVNAQLASYETLKKFAIMPTLLTIESGLLTPTAKVKRKAVYAAFQLEFEALYGEAA